MLTTPNLLVAIIATGNIWKSWTGKIYSLVKQEETVVTECDVAALLPG